jgi:hypothetical protein
MTHISQSAWLNVYGTCKKCGATVSHYCCIDALFAVRPLAEGFDWWVACDNDLVSSTAAAVWRASTIVAGCASYATCAAR